MWITVTIFSPQESLAIFQMYLAMTHGQMKGETSSHTALSHPADLVQAEAKQDSERFAEHVIQGRAGRSRPT